MKRLLVVKLAKKNLEVTSHTNIPYHPIEWVTNNIWTAVSSMKIITPFIKEVHHHNLSITYLLA